MNKLSERLKFALKESSQSRYDLYRHAKKSKESQKVVDNWLSGKTESINSKSLIPLAAALNVNPEWLATGEGQFNETLSLEIRNLIKEGALDNSDKEVIYDLAKHLSKKNVSRTKKTGEE